MRRWHILAASACVGLTLTLTTTSAFAQVTGAPGGGGTGAPGGGTGAIGGGTGTGGGGNTGSTGGVGTGGRTGGGNTGGAGAAGNTAGSGITDVTQSSGSSLFGGGQAGGSLFGNGGGTTGAAGRAGTAGRAGQAGNLGGAARNNATRNLFGQGQLGGGANQAPLIRARVVSAVSAPTIAPSQVASTVTSRLGQLASTNGARGIRVTMEGRTAVLTGTVPDEREARIVARMAGLEPGVSRVDNRLTIAGVETTPLPPASPSDIPPPEVLPAPTNPLIRNLP